MGRRCSPAWLHQASRSTQPAITTEITKHESEQDLMIKAPETVGDVTLDEPRGPAPGVVDLPQRGMTPSPFPEPVGPVGKPWLVNCLKEQANHFTNQLVGP